MTMLEKVARAIETEVKADPYVFVPGEGPKAGAFGLNYEAFVRSVFSALLVPDEGMVSATGDGPATSRRIFTAMIRHAIGDES